MAMTVSQLEERDRIEERLRRKWGEARCEGPRGLGAVALVFGIKNGRVMETVRVSSTGFSFDLDSLQISIEDRRKRLKNPCSCGCDEIVDHGCCQVCWERYLSDREYCYEGIDSEEVEV